MDYFVRSSFNESTDEWDVSVSGEIDIFNSGEFKEQLIELTKQKEINIRINCENLQYMDSTALGSLVAVLKAVRTYGGDIYLVKLKSTITKLFRITDLDKVFVIETEERKCDSSELS